MVNHSNTNQKKAEKVILISEKSRFWSKKCNMDTDNHFTMIKGLIHQEDIKIINVYSFNNRASKCIK